MFHSAADGYKLLNDDIKIFLINKNVSQTSDDIFMLLEIVDYLESTKYSIFLML